MDLGGVKSIAKVVINWEAAYANKYDFRVSVDETTPWDNMETVFSEDNGNGGQDVHKFNSIDARYVQLNFRGRQNKRYGHSMYDFQVFGPSDPTTLPTTYLTHPPTVSTAPSYSAGPSYPAGTILYKDSSQPTPLRVNDLLGRMTLSEKIRQMTQVELKFLVTDQDIETYNIGSLLSGGGSSPTQNEPQAWADMVDAYQAIAMSTPLGIPLIYGIDSVHGHSNVVGATIFPHNVGLGATRNASLVREVGKITGKEVYATGIPWNFSPCLAVARDIRWGRTYESFGEHPEIATPLGAAYMEGLQEEGVLPTPKVSSL